MVMRTSILLQLCHSLNKKAYLIIIKAVFAPFFQQRNFFEASSECLKRRMHLVAVERLPEEHACFLNYSLSFGSSNYRLSK